MFEIFHHEKFKEFMLNPPEQVLKQVKAYGVNQYNFYKWAQFRDFIGHNKVRDFNYRHTVTIEDIIADQDHILFLLKTKQYRVCGVSSTEKEVREVIEEVLDGVESANKLVWE